MSWFESFRYEVYAWLDRIFGLSGYFEGAVDARYFAIELLQRYVSELIEYFEDISFDGADEKNSAAIKTMDRIIKQSNSALEEINGFQQHILKDLEDRLFSVMMKGSAQYAEQRGFRGNSKSIFDAKSCEVKHLLYMMDGGEEFIFRDLFIKAKIVKRRLVLELDRQTLESQKWHEYEFSDEFRMKYSKSASSSCSPQE